MIGWVKIGWVKIRKEEGGLGGFGFVRVCVKKWVCFEGMLRVSVERVC